ncbi:MAG: hypothetical protein WD844_13080 [Thermoleophilaceae bacterium]
MTRVQRRLAAVALVGCCAAVAGAGTWSAFSDTTANESNGYAAGTVLLSDNDAGTALLSLSGAMPGASSTGCILVTYGGSLDADVRLYASVSGALAPHLVLTVTRGTDAAPSFDSCASFSPEPGDLFDGPLSSYPGTYGTGIADPEAWSTGESHSYRVRAELADDPAAENLTATATFTWEARNR